MDYKTPFSDAIGDSTVPIKSSGSCEYDALTVPNTPKREGGMYPEVTFDTHWGGPKMDGPVKDSPFKDAVK
jgi:hypothetical protein